MISPITYPARPKQGGPLDLALKAGAYSGRREVCIEPKYNGWRVLVHAPTGTMFNRHAERLTISKEFAQALDALAGLPFEWLDCEGLERRHGIGRGALIILDWVTEQLGYRHRRRHLAESFVEVGTANLQPGSVCLVPSYDDLTDGLLLWHGLPAINAQLGCTFYEGVVAKFADSEYPIQLRSSSEECPDWVKHRFTTK